MNTEEIVAVLNEAVAGVKFDNAPVSFNGHLITGVTLDPADESGQRRLHILLGGPANDTEPEEGPGYN
jgi:hypothetical protein